jgi:hypothetical protein
MIGEILRFINNDANFLVVTLNVVKCLIEEILHLRKLRFRMTEEQPSLPFLKIGEMFKTQNDDSSIPKTRQPDSAKQTTITTTRTNTTN